jgi:hypothetical protein
MTIGRIFLIITWAAIFFAAFPAFRYEEFWVGFTMIWRDFLYVFGWCDKSKGFPPLTTGAFLGVVSGAISIGVSFLTFIFASVAGWIYTEKREQK